MKTETTPPARSNDPEQGWDTIHQRLDDVLYRLKMMDEKKDLEIAALRRELQECGRTVEGTRQLINKLLNDIDNYRKDIAWYRRTYETRSLAGAVWQKLLRKRHTKP